MYKTLTLFFILLHVTVAFSSNVEKRHILYLMQVGQINEAFSRYQEICKDDPDFSLLNKMALLLLEKGTKSLNNQDTQLSMLGAGIAFSLDILKTGLFSPDPKTQLIALHFISQMQDNRSFELLKRAMISPFLMTRMEAAYSMACLKHPQAVGYIESLMNKLPPFFKVFFPALFGMIKTPEATAIFKRFFNDPILAVRLEAMSSSVKFERDDLLFLIKKKADSLNPAEREAALSALGYLKDSSSLDTLKKNSLSSSENIKLAACRSLYLLGENNIAEEIKKMALNFDLFAISSLSEIEGSEDLLYNLTQEKDIQVRFNAAISLLKRKDRRACELVKKILVKDVSDMELQPLLSIGKSSMAYKIVFSSTQLADKKLIDLELSTDIKKNLLKDALELDEKDFLDLADFLLNSLQKDLIPTVISLLENLNTNKAIFFLKDKALHSRYPLIRTWCHLALYKLKENHEDYLINWLNEQKQSDIIQISSKNRVLDNHFELSTEETSQLLLEAYGAISDRQDQKTINILITSIKKGNPHNRYALAGFLIKATR